jgi:peptidoglycan L-alanyl-D-glutamate endopeptidase CwlK
MSKFSKRSLDNLKGVHPDLVRIMNEAIKETPMDFTIICGVRTAQQQQELYAQGRTKPGAIVTNADGVKNKSNHQPKADGYGHAIDLYPYYNGSVQVNAPVSAFKTIATHILGVAKQMSVSIEWGGNWRSINDYPHIEIK